MKTSESGVDQLIKRVKSEAIDQAQIERADIIKAAKLEAANIIDKAKLEATSIYAHARSSIDHERQKMTVELTMAARDFNIKLTERLKSQMYFPMLKENLRATLKEPDFLKQVLVRIINDYLKTNPSNLDILVSKELKTTLSAYFAAGIFDSLDKNSSINIRDEDGIEGFVLIKRGSNYVWDFTLDTIAHEISNLVEPGLRKYFMPTTQVTHDENTGYARA